jgi:hypothetical protein
VPSRSLCSTEDGADFVAQQGSESRRKRRPALEATFILRIEHTLDPTEYVGCAAVHERTRRRIGRALV